MIALLEAAPTVLGREHNGILMTPEEFDAVEDWDRGCRYELIHGVLVVSPPPGAPQRRPNDILAYWLWAWHHEHPEGKRLDDTLHEQIVKIGAQRRIVDRAIWTGLGRQPDVDNDPPTICVEFVSPGRRSFRRDYEEKRADYASVKVKEYWVIDRFQRTMTVFRRLRRNWRQIVVREDETYRTDLLPGFELPLGRLLKFADRQ
ncbi:MAG TPA: Uma2 family endonuclease [Planctomycetaceae bacterium]|nr:Uma2 family endonuclease [Planctomycetaceae bacterium]